MGHDTIAGEIRRVVAFRHVGGFPERGRQRRKDQDVLLCIDCLDDWVEAGADPYFADRVIAADLVYLDKTGNESLEPTERYVKSVTHDELTPDQPRRCPGCKMPWDEAIGDRIIHRGAPSHASSEMEEDELMNQSEMGYEIALGEIVEEVGEAARRLATLLVAIADSGCVSEISFTVDPREDEGDALLLSVQQALNASEASWRQLLTQGSTLGYSVEEITVTREDLPEGQNTFETADFRINETPLPPE